MKPKRIISTAIAMLAAGSVIMAAPPALGAQTPGHWEPCAAIDTEPICEILHPQNEAGSRGTAVTHRPLPDDTAVWTGDTKDQPNYGPVQQVDPAPTSDCLPADRSPTAGDVAACGSEKADGTAAAIDIPDYNCDLWRNPVVACPGPDGTGEAQNLH